MQNTKQFLLIIASSFLYISSFFWIGNDKAEAAYVSLEYQLPDPVGDSIVINSKEQYDTVANWIKNKPSNHTGWSAVLFRYNAEATTIYDGKETNWWPVLVDGKYSTQDGFEGVTYPVSMFKDKIIAEHGQALYDRLVASGLRFDVKSGQSVKDYQVYSHDSRTQFSNPKTGDLGFLYYENKVTVYLEHYYDETTPIDPTEPEPEPEPEPDENIAPIAIIDTMYPSYKMGDRVVYWGSDSYDPDAEPNSKGEIIQNGIRSFYWKHDENAVVEDVEKGEEGDSYSLYYMKEGTYDTLLRVKDKDGASDETTYPILILPPTIEATIHASGTLKENRHVILKTEIDTPEKFPLIPEKTVWTIKALDGQENSVCVRGNETCQDSVTITGKQNLDVLFKNDEAYEISLHVENTAGYTYDTKEVVTPKGYSDPYLYIAEDELPIAVFSTANTIYRDAENEKKATIRLIDKSVSNDDVIAKRIWSIQYDSDNDGNFLEENTIIIDEQNNTEISYDVDKVGKYLIALEVKEAFAQPTLEEFVTEQDRLTDNTNELSLDKTVVEVQNLAPVVGYEVKKRKSIDLNIAVGTSSTGDLKSVEGKINELLVPRLNEEGVKLNLNLINVPQLKKADQDRQLVQRVERNGITFFEFYMFHDEEYIYAETVFYNVKNESGETPEAVSWGTRSTFSGARWDFNNTYIRGTSRGDWIDNKSTKIVKVAKISNKNIEVVFDLLQFEERNGSKTTNKKFYNVKYSAVAEDYIGPDIKVIYRELVTECISSQYSSRNDYCSYSLGWQNYQNRQMHTLLKPAISLEQLPSNSEQIVRFVYDYWVTQPDSNAGSLVMVENTGTWIDPTWNNQPGYSTNPMWRLHGSGAYLDLTNSFRKMVDNRMLTGWRVLIEPTGLVNNANGFVHNDGDDPEFEIKYIEEPYSPPKMELTSDGNATFFAAIEDNEMGNYGLNYVKETLSKSKAKSTYFIGLGTSKNQSQFESLINNNEQNGIFINNMNLDSSVQQLGDYILEVLDLIPPENNELYITLDEQVDYVTTYSDAENDMKLAEKWKYDHNPNVFENNQGQIEDNMIYQEKPITQFSKIGRYQPYFTAQDDPLERFAEMGLDSTKFENYRKWAKDSDNWYIYVHRKPVALFEPYMLNTTGQIVIYDKSYDLDKQSLPENGIKDKHWSYRKFGTTDWTEGKPTVLDKSSTWEIRQIVTDYQGATDEYIARVNAVTELPNKPPVAEILVNPIHYIGDTIFVTNNSSDPDGDVLTYTYEVTNPDGQIEIINQGDSRMDNNGNLSIIADTHPSDLGNWTFTLTVSDGTETASATASTVVLDQTIQGQVAHTEQWLRNLEKYNLEYPSKAINLDPAVGLVEFLPGERFVLNSNENTTNRLVSVESYIKESSRGADYKSLYGTVSLNRFDEQNFKGSLWNGTMIERFHDGETLTFEFVGTFENGWIDTETVQVRIKDDLYWRQHTSY